MTVTVGEAHIGHVAAVALITVVWGLMGKKRQLICGECCGARRAKIREINCKCGAVLSLTLGFGQGYWKRWTLQKSSATATNLSLWERQRALMSVPSEPSNHTPVGRHNKKNKHTTHVSHSVTGKGLSDIERLVIV